MMKRTKLWFMAAVISFCGIWMPTSAQDLVTKKAAPKTKLINVKKAPFANNLKNSHAVDDKKPVVKTHVPGIPFAEASGWKSVAMMPQIKASKSLLPMTERTVPAHSKTRDMDAARKVRGSAGEEIDEHGIIVEPAEGVRKVYERSGIVYTNNGFSPVEQGKTVHIVECPDGTVYVRNIVTSYPTGAWVKGTREGNTITILARQPVYYNENAGTTFSIRWGYNEGFGFSCYDEYNGGKFEFTVDDEAQTISLQNSSETFFMGLFWDDDDAFAWAGEYESVWTYQKDFEPLPVVTVTLPEGLQTEEWYAKGHYAMAGIDEAKFFVGNVIVGFDGQDIYLQKVFTSIFDEWQSYFDDLPSPMNVAWIKGTIDGDLVTFKGLQLLGDVDGNTYYAVGSDGSDLTDFTMIWDEENKVLKSQNYLLANADLEDISARMEFLDLTIQLEDPNKPIETLPYTNGFDNLDEWDSFKVVDANQDGSTWHRYTEEDVSEASYKYNSDNNADDWLISPAIILEAGKVYSLAFDVHGSTDAYVERVEAALIDGNAELSPLKAEISPLQTVIAPTEVQTESPIALSNRFITVEETGSYRFGIHAISDADQASLRVDNFIVSETVLTAPAAVTDLTVTADAEKPMATINFTAPTKSIGGDDLTGNMTHIDILRDNEVITSFEDVAPGAQLCYVDEDESLTGTSYRYQVVAYNADGQGDFSEVVTVRLNVVFDIPYVADFTQDAVGGQFMQIDANDDGRRWEWDGGSHAVYEYNSDMDADDYLVSPALHMDAGKRYNILVDAGSAGYTERFEVLVGREPSVEGLNVKVLENCEVTTEDSKIFEAVFQAEETGTYYVAVHCISEADMYELWVNKVIVDFAPEMTAPAAPELTVTPGEMGAKMATITIKTPTTDIAGDALTDNLTLVELYRDDEVIMEFPDVTPGAELLYTDTDMEYIGNYSYQAVPYNADGIGMKSEKVVAYIGCDVPENVKNVKAMDMGTSVLLTWDKVTEVGQNGGYVNPDEVEYVIYECEPNVPWSKPEPLAVLADADSYTIEFNSNEGEPGFQKWFVVARNEAGGSSLTDESSATVLIGKPYDLPVVEGFADNNLHYYWESNSDPLTFSQSSDEDGYAIAMVMREPGEMYLNSGKLNVKDAANPVLLFDAVGFGVESVNVNGRVDGGEAIQLATESLSNENYKTIKVELNELKSGNYAQFGLTATINNATTFDWWGDIEEVGDALVVDNIRVVDLLSHNLSVELSAPTTIQAGKSTEISAVVTNWGEQAANDFTVIFMMDDEVLSQESVSDVLAPFSSREFTAKLNTTVFDEAADRVIKVLVDYDADQKVDDNTAETILTVNDSEVPAPMNLTAENKENGVELNWDEPVSEPAEFIESFDNIEAFPTFSIGGITDSQHEGSISEWTLYDGNGAEVYSWDSDVVQYDNRYAPSAWMVFDFVMAGFASNVAHSGNQVMLSMCPVPNDGLGVSSADHWLISPELPGTAQQISFYARAITNRYGDETFEVLASTTDNKPESFELVEAFATDNESWELFTTALPEGTKYFAIRHTSNDVFGLMLDDISFNYVGVVCKYNIYSDSKLLATVEKGVTTFTVDGALLEEGEHTFGVTAVYANGQESKPAKATIMVTTDIRQIMVDGKPVDIYTIDGRLVRRQATSLNGLRGLYLVEGRKVLIP